MSATLDKTFAGAIPEIYERFLVPLIFAPYADDMATRVVGLNPGRVLEIAAGTGVVTRALARALPGNATIVATDLNPPMLAQAARMLDSPRVEWQQADAMALPFEDASFDTVVCQFGAMFFPDRARAYAEARRVLRPGGAYVFNVWDRIEANDFADVVTAAVAAMFPQDPPRFLARTPHGYHDVHAIAHDLAQGGFAETPAIDTVTAQSRAPDARAPAFAYCQGTPLRNEIEARDPTALQAATDAASDAIAQRFGRGPVVGTIRAHVITARG